MGGQSGTPTFSASGSLPPAPPPTPPQIQEILACLLGHSAGGRGQGGGESAKSHHWLIPVGGGGRGERHGELWRMEPLGVSGTHPFPGSLLDRSLENQAQRTPEVSDCVGGNKVQATPFWMVPVLSTRSAFLCPILCLGNQVGGRRVGPEIGFSPIN